MNIDLTLVSNLILGFIPIFWGFFSFIPMWKNYKLAKKSENWLQTTGTIVKSEQVYSWVQNYCPDIHYKYSVDKQEYHSSQISIYIHGLLLPRSRSASRKYVSRYPVGKQVTVHYSPYIYQLPDKERYSVLEKGVRRVIFIYAFGLIDTLFVAGGFTLLFNVNVEYAIWVAVAGALLGGWAGSKIKPKLCPCVDLKDA